jgi:hypothetical protein
MAFGSHNCAVSVGHAQRRAEGKKALSRFTGLRGDPNEYLAGFTCDFRFSKPPVTSRVT